ncbi:CapA family protein [Dactylosporangium sp. CS-033363]|uniref:CapA family protein n=1 Tax=Dactylosporangium sp. CS-033363 TaxID=3239935 RepID=UPI003D93542A
MTRRRREPGRRPAPLRWAPALAMLLLAACSTPPSPAHVPAPVATSAPASPISAPPPSPAAADLTLAFAGDVHFTGRTAGLLKDPATAIGPMTQVLAGADLAVVNLESAVTTRGTPEPKEYHFRAPSTAYDALKAAGIDAVTIANNHALDYGRVGFADTLDAASATGMPVFGGGRNIDEAYKPLLLTVRGVHIALLAFSQIHTLADEWKAGPSTSGIAMAWDVQRAVAAVRTARTEADLVIVFNHWGTETVTCPNNDQKSFAKSLADAGADLIIGAHAHVLQGDGWLGRTYVAYGLGNFVWYVGQAETGVLRVQVHGRDAVSAELSPALVASNGQPKPVTGSAAGTQLKRFADLRRCTGLAATPSPT